MQKGIELVELRVKQKPKQKTAGWKATMENREDQARRGCKQVMKLDSVIGFACSMFCM